eukprot:TRINITY_DN10501_c0_g1_i4.p1 TRINITY_DN10501_c0_g1~~TRINITY_DN10501_c0_g1_i4.p1  ORF type:complete len:100 (+),score=19.04 TRINITY_DN10501_c0_g1_i4:139-438(+)
MCIRDSFKGIIFFTPKKCAGDPAAAQAEADRLKWIAEKMCRQIESTTKDCRFCKGFLLEVYKTEPTRLKEAQELCDELVDLDKIRKNYWKWIKERLTSS